VKDYLDMPVLRFYDIWQAICELSRRKAREHEQAAREAKRGGGHKRRR